MHDNILSTLGSLAAGFIFLLPSKAFFYLWGVFENIIIIIFENIFYL
jgi:hypothetical protein